MTEALTNSVNTYWAQVGEQLGTETMVEYMERFGFYSDPPLDFPKATCPSFADEAGILQKVQHCIGIALRIPINLGS